VYAQIRALDGLTEVRAVVGARIDDTSPWIQTLLSRAREGSVPELLRANAERDRLRVQLLQFMSDHPVLLMPVAAVPAFPLGQHSFQVDGTDLPYVQLGANCRAISLFGCPAAVIRCGTSIEGLPIGIQIVCPPFMDHLALAVAAFLEHELGTHYAPPLGSTTRGTQAVD
jgi:amidase